MLLLNTQRCATSVALVRCIPPPLPPTEPPSGKPPPHEEIAASPAEFDENTQSMSVTVELDAMRPPPPSGVQLFVGPALPAWFDENMHRSNVTPALPTTAAPPPVPMGSGPLEPEV